MGQSFYVVGGVGDVASRASRFPPNACGAASVGYAGCGTGSAFHGILVQGDGLATNRGM